MWIYYLPNKLTAIGKKRFLMNHGLFKKFSDFNLSYKAKYMDK